MLNSETLWDQPPTSSRVPAPTATAGRSGSSFATMPSMRIITLRRARSLLNRTRLGVRSAGPCQRLERLLRIFQGFATARARRREQFHRSRSGREISAGYVPRVSTAAGSATTPRISFSIFSRTRRFLSTSYHYRPAIAKAAEFLPEPNSGMNVYNATETLHDDTDQFGVKVDH